MPIQDFTLRAILFTIIFAVFKSPLVLLVTGLVAGTLWYDSHPQQMRKNVCIASTWVTENTGVNFYSNKECEILGLKKRLQVYDGSPEVVSDYIEKSNAGSYDSLSAPLNSQEFENLGKGVQW